WPRQLCDDGHESGSIEERRALESPVGTLLSLGTLLALDTRERRRPVRQSSCGSLSKSSILCPIYLTLSQISFTVARMSFREKSAWISFFCLLIFGGLYGWHVVQVEFFHARDNPMVYVGGTFAALVALEIALHVAIAIQSPK